MAAGPMSLLAMPFQTALHMSWHSVLLRGTVGLKHGRYQGATTCISYMNVHSSA